jgi:hypothetical protein
VSGTATEQAAAVADQAEPRWPALVAAVAATGLYAALPEGLAVGPRWLLGAVVAVLALGTILARQGGYHRTNVLVGHLLSGTLTVFMLWSLGLLVNALPSHKEQPVALLRSAAVLWATNVLVFALWYWRLDAGGPHARDLRTAHETGSFLFPQMMLDGPAALGSDGRPWSPQFVDYLFLAFNTSTAFSPTDVPVLSRGAKVLVMIQSMISLSIVVILAARAVNVL